jgi:hypothetical protein
VGKTYKQTAVLPVTEDSVLNKSSWGNGFVFFFFFFFLYLKKLYLSLAVVAYAFNPSTWEAEAGGYLSLRPAWSTE